MIPVLFVLNLVVIAIDWLFGTFRWQFLAMCAAVLIWSKAVNFGRPR